MENLNETQKENPSDELEFNILVVEDILDRMKQARLKVKEATINLAEKINMLDEEMTELEKDLDKFSEIGTEEKDDLSAIRTNPNQGII